MQIYQPKEGYCYNSDTLFLYDFVLKSLKPKKQVLEVGSGSGVLGLLCAREVEMNLAMIEKNPKMLELCQHNLRVNKIRANLIGGDFLEYDFLDLKFDYILSNPPFYHNGVIRSKNSDICLARYEENLPFSAMVKKINTLLNRKGNLFFAMIAGKVLRFLVYYLNLKLDPLWCAMCILERVRKQHCYFVEQKRILKVRCESCLLF